MREGQNILLVTKSVRDKMDGREGGLMLIFWDLVRSTRIMSSTPEDTKAEPEPEKTVREDSFLRHIVFAIFTSFQNSFRTETTMLNSSRLTAVKRRVRMGGSYFE